MRILGACIFLSFLAGKLRHFNRMLLTKFQKLGICVFLSTRIFFFFKLLTANLRNFVNIYLFRLRYNLSKRKAFWKSEDTIFAWNLTSVGIVVKI